MRRRFEHAARDEDGVTTVEFALVVPVLIVILLAAMDFSRAIYAYATVTNGSREGVRYAVLHPSASFTSIETEVERRTRPLDPSGLRVRIESSTDGGLTYVDWFPKSFGNTSPVDERVRVTVTYPWEATSVIASAFFSVSGGPVTLTSVSYMDTRR